MSLKMKTEKILSSSFMDAHRDINEDEAMVKITEAEMALKAILEEKKNDDKLQAAKDIAKELSSGYNASLKYEKAKIQFLLERIEAVRETELASKK